MRREVQPTIEKGHMDRVESLRVANMKVARPFTRVPTKPGADRTVHRNSNWGNLEHKRWIGPWKVRTLPRRGFLVEVEIEGGKPHIRRVATSAVKLFCVRPPDLGHPVIEESAQYICEPTVVCPERQSLLRICRR